MNRFSRWLALKLINRELNKMHKATAHKLINNPKMTFVDAAPDPSEYFRLIYLRQNIESIHNPWQGIFSARWTVWPKDQSKVKPFSPFEYDIVEDLPLPPHEQVWADMDDEEFFEQLNLEDAHRPDVEIIGQGIYKMKEQN